MRTLHALLAELRQALIAAERWHATMLREHPLYRAAMQLLAALLLGQLRGSTPGDWLRYAFHTAQPGY